MTIEYVIEAKAVNKTFGDLHIVKNCSLKVAKGEFVVVLGKSGSGKTSLLSLLSGLDNPDSGEIILCGEHIESCSEEMLARTRRDKIGFVFQNFNLLPTLSALQNVMLPLLPVKKEHSDLKERALSIMKTIEIDHRSNHQPAKLSGGEKQRVAIARALINKPVILFADEPTGNLDSATGKTVIELLLKLKNEQGITILMVTHDEEYVRHADRVIKIVDGEIKNEI
jgi:ABC-type lipoprotein export system ATPase subunit